MKVLFYVQNKADLGPSPEGQFQWQKQAGQRVTTLELRFLDGELAGWGALYDGIDDVERAEIRQDIENRLAKSATKK